MRTLSVTPFGLTLGPVIRIGVLGAFALSGCEDEPIQMLRPDSGAPQRDAGTSGPLPLTQGMTFSYNAFLTFRGAAQGQERNATYTLEYTIDAVDDQGGVAESSITVSASGSNTLNDDWEPTADFDSWVARLGPALTEDRITPGGTNVMLEQVLEAPPAPAPPPKTLPRPDTFFLDVRKISDLKVAFSEKYQGRSPQTVDPQDNNGTFLFAYGGAEPAYAFHYDAGTNRTIRVEYDPRGFLVRLDEQIGEANDPPSLTARITLTSGP